MNNKKSLTHLIFTIVHFVMAILTLLPTASASKVSMLGYKALCSFSPIGTIILITLSFLHFMIYKNIVSRE